MVKICVNKIKGYIIKIARVYYIEYKILNDLLYIFTWTYIQILSLKKDESQC